MKSFDVSYNYNYLKISLYQILLHDILHINHLNNKNHNQLWYDLDFFYVFNTYGANQEIMSQVIVF